MSEILIDEIDQKILRDLIKDARTPFLEIARECGVSGAAVHQRVKKLQQRGIISGSRLLVKPSAIGLNICAFVSISLSEANKYQEVVERLKKVPEITECHFVTGKATLFVKMYCSDNEHLMRVIVNTLQMMPYVESTETMIALEEAFERQVWVKDYKNAVL